MIDIDDDVRKMIDAGMNRVELRSDALKNRDEALSRFHGALKEMYFEASGVYEYPDRIFFSQRMMDLVNVKRREPDVPTLWQQAEVSLDGEKADMLLIFKKEHELKSDVETFGDLLDKELEPAPPEIIRVQRSLPDHFFDEVLKLNQ